MATTSTYSKTYSRIGLLQVNLRAALANYGWPKHLINSLVDVGLADENRFVSTFHTFGMIPNTEDWELHAWVSVDWDEHGRLLINAENVTVDDHWEQGVNPGLAEQADGFASLVRQLGLEFRYAWAYSDVIARDASRKQSAIDKMGLSGKTITTSVQPAGTVADTQTNRVAGLGELSFGSESAFRD